MLRGVIRATALLRSLTYLIASLSASAFIWVFTNRKRGNLGRSHYCLSNMNVLVNSLPSEFVPFAVAVITLPPLEITVRPVA